MTTRALTTLRDGLVLPETFVAGVPLPKGSPEIHRRRDSGRAFVRESDACVAWQQTIAWTVRAALGPGWVPVDFPVHVELLFILPRIASAPRSMDACVELAAVKPDGDKLERAVWDALEGVVYVNDSRVTSSSKRKRVLPRSGGDTGAFIEVWRDRE